MKGTTFSGHPTLTTLGNTLRSICYVNYVQGFNQNWFMKWMAAGDDVVVFCWRSDSASIISDFKTHVATDNKFLSG